ncbi:MAG TPA: LapA family protein [Gemmatimonadales bacterium]
MTFGYLLVALLTAAVVVFAFQNGTPVSVKFLAWTVPETSVAAVILIALVMGLLIAAIPLWLQRWRLRVRVRSLEAQVRQLETALEERNKAVLSPRPSSIPDAPTQ